MLLIMLLTTASAWADTETVSYIDAYGTEKSVEATVLTGGVGTTLTEGWYVVKSDITYTGTITISGYVAIILADGKTMTVNTSGYGFDLGTSDWLTIYGQSAGTGRLTVSSNSIAIWGLNGNGTVNIIGGTVNATATGNYAAITAYAVNITGGQVTATAGSKGIDGNITLGCRKLTDFIKSNGYSGNVKIKSGQTLYDGATAYSGTLTYQQCDALAGKTLRPFSSDDLAVSDDGTEYTIKTATGWGLFCDMLADNDKGIFTGKTVKLGANIEVTRMAGSDYHDFTGTFDGNKKTLTFNYGENGSPVTAEYAAPFRNVENGNIQNLHVSGDIYTSAKYAAGIAGKIYGTVNIQNCHSSIVIHSSVTNDDDNDGTHGGFAATSNGTLNITGCVFDGKLLTVNTGETATTKCGGFVGYGTCNISNSLYAPATPGDGETEITGSSATFVRNATPGTNCYYTRTLGTAQGKAPRTISGGEGVTIEAISPVGSPVENGTYSVSGITAYTKGITRTVGEATTFYYGNEDQVSLTLGFTGTAPAGYTFNGYEASAGNLSGSDNPYTLTMPDADVTVSANFEVLLHDFTVGDLTYHNTSATEATVTGCNSSATSITIPATVTDNTVTYNVTAIGEKAFCGCSKLSIIYCLATMVPTLGSDDAFDDCHNDLVIVVPADAYNSYNTDWSDYSSYLSKGYTLTCGTGVTATSDNNGPLVQKDEEVTLDYTGTVPEGSVFGGYFYGSHLTRTNTFDMPAEDVTVTAAISPLSGTCGTTDHEADVTWALTDTDTDGKYDLLTINGTGAMADYDADTQPWTVLKSDINTLIVGEGITAIGSNAFNGCTSLERAYILPTTVPTTSDNVFDGCDALSAIVVPGVARDRYWSEWYGKNNYPYAPHIIEGYTVTCASGITVTTQYNGPLVKKDEVVTITNTVPSVAPEGYEAPFLGYKVMDTNNLIQPVTEEAGVYTFPMPDCYATVMPAWTPKAWTGNGTQTSPYIIEYASQLDLLAERVNSGTDPTDTKKYEDYTDTYFELGRDIEYAHTTDWDDAASTEKNFTSIGCFMHTTGIYYAERSFNGHFDGKGHRISGIRIFSRSNSYCIAGYEGIFGNIGPSATVSGIILDDTRITGHCYIGGIAGHNDGIISDCHVTDKVNIHVITDGSTIFGGIAGSNNDGTISGCTSAVSITSTTVEVTNAPIPYTYKMSTRVGGIAGSNYSTLKDCLYLGTTLEGEEMLGAIAGVNGEGSSVENSYDSSSALTITLGEGITLGGTATAYTVSGLTAYGNFALSNGTAIYSAKGNTVTLAYTGSVPEGKIVLYSYNDGTDDNDVIGNTFQMPASNVTVAATFQSGYQSGAITIIYKEDQEKKYAVIDGNYSGSDGIYLTEHIWVDHVTYNRTFPTNDHHSENPSEPLNYNYYNCTIMLPFEVNTHQLTGVDYIYTFSGVEKDRNDTWVVTMTKVWESGGVDDVYLTPYTPYLVSMKSSSLGITGGVTFVPTIEAVTFVGDWEFRGTNNYTIWDATHNNDNLGRVYGFAATAVSGDGIAIGDFVRATAGAYIYPLRAYLFYGGDDPNWDKSSQAPRRASDLDGLPDRMPVRIIGKEATSLTPVPSPTGEGSDYWYTLSGTRLDKQPTQKGIYIVNGKKVVIK